MSNSFPKRNLPLRVVLNRVGEATLAQYAAAHDPMDSPEMACQLWREVVAVYPSHEPDKEHLVAVLLNAKLRMIRYHVVSVGSLNEALAHPREIFRAAILAGAYALILMHNHPSGDPTPSEADRRLTKNIREAAGVLQISLLDHVIVGSPSPDRQPYFSFREAGLL
jgi:DNA repair protein RadC